MKTLVRAVGIAAGLALAAGAAMSDEIRLRAAHGSPTGTSGQIMTYLSNVIDRVDPNISIELSGDNPGTRQLLQGATGEADLHLFVPFISSLLKDGAAMYSDVPNNEELFANLRVMMMRPGGTYQLLAWADSGIESLEDLRGKNVYFGPRGAAVSRMMQDLVRASTGMEPGEDFELISLDFSSAFQAFQDVQIDTWFRPVPVGHPAIQQISALGEFRLIGLSEDDLANPEIQELSSIPGRSVVQIPPDAYGDNQINDAPITSWQDWQGIGIPAHVDDDVAYSLTKAFWENIDELASVAAWAGSLEIADFRKFTNVPVHPGAARYYEELGFEIPVIE